MRVSNEQKIKLLEFMQAHEDLARGRAGPDAARRKKQLLGGLASALNSMGFGATKTPAKWLKCWQDWKCDVKTKAVKIKKHRDGTGGGPSPAPLSNLEVAVSVDNEDVAHDAQEPAKERKFDDVPTVAVQPLPPKRSTNLAYFSEKPRASNLQFDMMITFMEEHGDITTHDTKPGVENNKLWLELTNLLNCDTSEDPKTWKHWTNVWHDLKTNSKKKARELQTPNYDSNGRSIRPSNKLTENEFRVLKVLGLVKDLKITNNSKISIISVEESSEEETGPQPILNIDCNNLSEDSYSPKSEYSSQQNMDSGNSPVIEVSQKSEHSKTPVQQTKPRRRRFDRKSEVDIALRRFQQSDRQWRKYMYEKSNREYENEKERLRLKEQELKMWEIWQNIAFRAMGVLEKKVNKNIK